MPRKTGPLHSRDDGTVETTLPSVRVKLHVRQGRVVIVETATEDGFNLLGWPWAWMAKDQLSFRWCRAAISVGLRGSKPLGLFEMKKLGPKQQIKDHKTGRVGPVPKVKERRRAKPKPHLFYNNRATDPLKPPPLGFTEDTLIGGPPPPPDDEEQ